MISRLFPLGKPLVEQKERFEKRLPLPTSVENTEKTDLRQVEFYFFIDGKLCALLLDGERRDCCAR